MWHAINYNQTSDFFQAHIDYINMQGASKKTRIKQM